MSKFNECSSKQQSSDCSDSCFDLESKCKEFCDDPCIKCKCPEELNCHYKDAVVEIFSEFILLGADFPNNGIIPLAPNSRADIILKGNGFFIKGHYIVVPAHLVLLPPSLTSVANRFPFIDDDQSLGQIKNEIIRASRILVTVFNVNGCGNSFIYTAKLVGVDGAGNIAVLRIDFNKKWNTSNPCIEKCHPFFTFGQSRAAKDGQKVYLIGHNLFVKGFISDHRNAGVGLAENILISATASGSGFPIIDCEGRVLGFKTFDQPVDNKNDDCQCSGLIGGPSEFFARRIIKILIQGCCETKCRLEKVCDPAGSYVRYRKAFAGLAYEVVKGNEYDFTVDFTSGLPPFGQPRIRLNSEECFISSPICKQIIGIRIVGIAGANPSGEFGNFDGFFYVPGGTGPSAFIQDLPNSPFLGKLHPGDIITHLEGVALGDLDCQIVPSLITWRLRPFDKVDIIYRRGGSIPNNSENAFTENYDDIFTFSVRLEEFPYVLDYPWYAVGIFPLLNTLPFPGFIFPDAQSTDPQTPSLSPLVGAPFHDAF